MPARYGAILDEPHPVPAIPDGVVDPKLWRTEVDNPFPFEKPGTVVVDPDAAYLHLITANDRALRYGVSVGAAGFGWNGDAVMQFGRKWPVWKAPDSMIARRPEFEPYSVANGGMPGGPGNPLGARALYLFQNKQDTLYRIHGACEPKYLGQAVSSGCIRLLDQDVIDLYDRVPHGAKVIVLASSRHGEFEALY
jgi:lipoprotein-anchoring transpeptidase ErfK/SrfK